MVDATLQVAESTGSQNKAAGRGRTFALQLIKNNTSSFFNRKIVNTGREHAPTHLALKRSQASVCLQLRLTNCHCR